MGSAIKLARAVHLVSALWTLGLAVLILLDVTGRGAFNHPVFGTKEIVQNSVVAITFLQLPLAIYSGSMLRTPIFADAAPPVVRRLLRTLTSLLGLALFLGLVWSTWPAFTEAYRIGEYEGEGALRVPTWPVRGIVLVTSAFGMIAYVMMIVYDWQGRLVYGAEAPGALRPADADQPGQEG